MKIEQLLMAALLAGAPFSVLAEPVPPVAPNIENVARQPVQESRTYRLTATDAERMRGRFQLVDGRILTVTARQNRLYAQLGDRIEELVPVAEHTFASKDSGNRFVFNRVPLADEVTLEPDAR